MTASRHPYAHFVHKVAKPARYLGAEYLSQRKDWDTVDITVCMAFPDLYDVGMSHLGTRIIYDLLNKDPRVACERAFSPWVDMEAELRARGLPLLSLESARSLADFDVVGISLQYEMTYTNALNLLDLCGIPLRTADRDASHPVVLAGGPAATHAEPMAPFIDAFLVGDAEELFPRALHALADWKRAAVPRGEQLARLAAMGGFYVPSLYDVVRDERSDLLVVDPETARGPYPVKRAVVADINRYPFPTGAPVAATQAIFDRASIEIARGCTEGCRFCQAGMIYRPVRERDPEAVVDAVIASLDRGGYDEASLTSLSTADYSCVSPLIKRVMEKLRARRTSLTVSSLRAYGLDEDLLDEISSVKATGLTFAPEAGTQRMRDVVNKNISEEDIMTTAERVFARGWSKMKFYFMIGLPTETDEDVAGIVHTAAKARDIGLRYHNRSRLRVTASASSHVPKPHTPFQWAAMDSLEEIARKQKLLFELGRERNISLKWHDSRVSFVEGVLARGDRELADLVELAFRKGARMDSWDDVLRFEAWTEAMTELGVDAQRYLGTIPVDGRLPWDHIDVGLEPGFLKQEWKRATKNRLSPPCGKPKGAQVHHTNVQDAEADQRKLICYHCGIACDMTQMREERVDFLTKLGAMAPRDRDAEGEDAFVPAYRQIRKNRKNQNLPPIRPSQGQAHHYRLQYTKLGAVAMTSHLDLARVLPRILRRAGLTPVMSRGFSPAPQMSFGPALTLGVHALAELVDVQLTDDLAPDALLARLNAVSDEGLVFRAAARLRGKVHAPSRVAKLAEYVVRADTLDDGRVREAVTRLLSGERVPMTVARKDSAREIDVTDGLVSAVCDRPTATERALLGLPADGALLRWRVDLNLGPHVRPTELAAALFGSDVDELPGFLAARTALDGHGKGAVPDLLSEAATRGPEPVAVDPGGSAGVTTSGSPA